MTDSHGSRQKNHLQPLCLFKPPPFFLSEANSSCQSVRINNVYWQISACVREDKTVGKVCRDAATFTQLCDVSKSSLVWEGADCVKERTPPGVQERGPWGFVLCLHTLTSSQPFKMPRYNHTSVKIGSERMICKRESRALNLHWLPEQKVTSGVFRM